MNNTGFSKFIVTLQSAFSRAVWKGIVTPAISQTVYMAIVTTLLTVIFGLILGIALVFTNKDGLRPHTLFNNIVGGVINALRSMPSVIIIGISYGPQACIIALAVSCIPMFSRLVQNSILEVPKGKIEAAQAMGAKDWVILFKVMLPEALPSLVRNTTVSIIAVISTTALAGNFGAGGLGDVAIRYGYNRFRGDVLIASVLILVILVNFVQIGGGLLSKFILKRRHLI